MKESSTLFNIYLCQLVFLALLEITEGSWIWPNFVAENRRVARQANRKCSDSEEMQCKSGECIKAIFKCNGKQDCADNSDESSLICIGSFIPVEPTKPTVTVEPVQTVIPPVSHTLAPPSVTPGSCKVPSNTRYKKFKIVCESGTSDKHCQAKAGMYVPYATKIRFQCHSDYVMPSQSTDGNQALCVDGNWIPAVKNCTKICENLNTNNMKISYPLNFGSKCDSTLLPGTVLKPECIDSNYIPEVPPTYSQIQCKDDGSWDEPLFACVPVCGVKSSDDVGPLISSGKREVAGDSPWHVAIYRKADKVLICGGTIVTEFMIISAAHCFYNRATDTINPIGNYDIMVSKFTRNYTKNDNSYTKVYELRNIFLPDGSYHDVTDSYTNDVVVLETKEKMVLSPYVTPACVEWTRSKKFNPSEGTVGKVVGWGSTGKSPTSEELLTADLPYSSPVSCREKVGKSLRRYITQDKFCAGNFTGAAVRKGDSGGGWLVPVKPYNLYNLYGVVSNDLGGLNSISSFTDIIQHIDWLNSVKSSIEQRTNGNEN